MVKPVLLKNIQIEGQLHFTTTHLSVIPAGLKGVASSRRCVHVPVFPVSTRLVQPGSWLLLLRTLPQQHLLP